MSEDALPARLDALESRLADLDEVQVHQRVVTHALESIWAHLQEKGVGGFPARVVAELEAGIESALARRASDPEALLAGLDLKALTDRLVLSASRPLMAAIDQRLESRRVKRTGADAPVEERLARIEQRLERLEIAGEGEAIERQLQAVVARVSALEKLARQLQMEGVERSS